MKNWVLTLLMLMICACSSERTESTANITDAIPVNSDLIIQFNELKKTNNKIKSFGWWKELSKIKSIKSEIEKIEAVYKTYDLQEVFQNKNKPVFLSLNIIGKNKPDFLFTTSISDAIIKSNKLLRAIHSNQNKSKVYDGVQINNIEFSTNNIKTNVFFSIHNNIFLLSFSEIIIQESIRQLDNGINIFELEPIKNLHSKLPRYSNITAIVKTKFLEEMIEQKNIFLNSNTWSLFDVELESTNILLNGVTNRGNIQYLKNCNYNDTKQSNIENLLPRHTTGFYKYQINNKFDLNAIMNIINGGVKDYNYHLSEISWEPTEINIAYEDNLFKKISYLIFRTNNQKECIIELNKQQTKSQETINYLDYKINELEIGSLKKYNWLHNVIKNWNQAFYIIIKDDIIFTDSDKKMKSLINNIVSNQTIGQSRALNIINDKVGRKSHSTFYLNFKNHAADWKQVFNSVVAKNIGSKDYFFNSLIFLTESERLTNLTKWTANLDSETNYQPQLVVNHYTKQPEIITQDINNNIYLIDFNGKRLWKKLIGQAILGKIHQIDTYRNNKLQYIFNTRDSIYLIDRNGKNVPPFPLKTKKSMSLPIALFDYDNNRNYRILATMGNEMNMYNQKGDLVTGWEFRNTESDVLLPPQHYQLFKKDYIVISEKNGQTHLLNRKGQKRVKVMKKINRSNNKLHLIKGNTLQNSKLITTNENGQLVYINFNGSVEISDIQNLKKGDIYITNNDHTMILKGKKLIFSNEKNKFEYTFTTQPATTPKVFSYNETTLIGIHNKTENLIYLLDEKGQLYNNPFFSTTDFDIIKYENKMHLINGSSEGIIYNYLIN